MKSIKNTKLSLLLLLLLVAVSCKKNTSKNIVFEEITTKDYILNKPTKAIKAVLVLFGGYPEKPKDVKREFPILKYAKKNSIAVLYMNYNQKLWMEQEEKEALAKQLEQIFTAHKLPSTNIYIGGFSSGGNVSLLLSNYIAEHQLKITPKGVFIVDSPIDLAVLYTSSEKNILHSFSAVSIQESTWLLKNLEAKFGNPHQNISPYETAAVFTSKTANTDNLKSLMTAKIRLYTEPDTLWWKKNRMADYEQTNAFYIKKLAARLTEQGFKNVAYIPTINKGYRSNGERHPHSWAIVDKKELIAWMLKK